MDGSASLETNFDPTEVFEVVSDLSTYPDWLNIVSEVVSESSTVEDSDVDTHWSVTLQAKVGPFRRSKRIRMKRQPLEELANGKRVVVFRRDENDGRSHSEWTMTGTVQAAKSGSTVEIELHYGGSLWVPVLDRLLKDEIESSKKSLANYLSRR